MQAGAVKIYVAAVRRSGKKKNSVKLSLPQKLMNANVLFCSLFLNLTLLMTKPRVLVLCFPYFTDKLYCIPRTGL
jgi:hypothetical protein